MWYPSQQQHSLYQYNRHLSSVRQQQQQRQQIYSRNSYYSNGDELSTTPINDENESSNHCHTSYGDSIHVATSKHSYGDEMLSYHQTISNRNGVIVAPSKSSMMNTPIPIKMTSKSCWDWVLFSPEYYSEFYSPSSSSSSTFVNQEKIENEDNLNEISSNLLASLPTCLLALLYLTPKLISTSDDENDSDQEMNSLHQIDESSRVSLTNHNSSSNIHVNLNLENKLNRSSTPDTDDGYQSASDASRSDYSQQSSVVYDQSQNNKDDLIINEHSFPIPLMPQRISYAAAVKPINTSSLSTAGINKTKQTINNSLPTTVATYDMANSNGQKLKFIAPRFERMHHAKQHTSSSSSNRTQIRSTNNNNNNNQQRNHTVLHPTRRR